MEFQNLQPEGPKESYLSKVETATCFDGNYLRL